MDSFRIKIKNFTATDSSYFDEIKSSSFANNSRYKRDRTSNAYRKEMVKRGIYIPKYAISEVNFGIPEKALVLEFSAGKLIHGTNLKDVSEKDRPLVVEKLSGFLKSIKVQIDRCEIENATTTLVAYAQNVLVDQFGSVQEIIRVIAPFDYRPRSKFTIAMDENGGAELKYFNNNSHLTLYAKLPEIRNNAVTKEEFAIIDYLDNGTNKEIYESWVKETLRVELTLHGKTAVKQALSEFYGKKTNFTLIEAFSDNIRDTLLRREIDNVFNHPLQKIVLLSSFDREVFNKVINEQCKTLAQKREMRVALDIFYTRGLKAYREDVLSQAVKRTWFRKQKQLKKISDSIVLPQGTVTQLNNAEILEYLLSQFGIESKVREPEQMGLF